MDHWGKVRIYPWEVYPWDIIFPKYFIYAYGCKNALSSNPQSQSQTKLKEPIGY